MMTEFKNSLTWRDTVSYAVSVFSFLILGEGEMSGRKFAEHIRNYCGCSDEKQKVILSDVEKHIVRIEATYKGTKYSCV